MWHTDLERVREAISDLPYLVRYSKRKYLDDWIDNGNLLIRNANWYAKEKTLDRQDWETTRSYLTGQYAHDDPRVIRIPVPPGKESTGNIDVRHVSVEAVQNCPDYWMFSMSQSLSPKLLKLFGGSCCVVIGQTEPLWAKFLFEVAEQIGSKKFTVSQPEVAKKEVGSLPLKLAEMREVSYLGPPDDLDPSSMDWSDWMKQVGDGNAFDHIFKKPAWYAHQDEVKFAWALFDSEDIWQHSHRWRFTVEDVKTGERHQLIEALEDENKAHWTYGINLPPITVQVTPPTKVIKLTLDQDT